MITEQTVRDDIRELRTRLPAYNPIFVGVLRFGAHLPHFWAHEPKVSRECHPQFRVILSHMLDFLPPEFYQGDTHFVVLDDTVYRGQQMKKHVRRLEALGVPRARITTAAVVVHEKSEYRPDVILRELSDRDYVEWKDCCTRLVRAQRRSTDRDHPLYFFEIDRLSSGAMLSLLQRFGTVSAIDDESYGTVYAFSVTMPSRRVLDGATISMDLFDAEGLTLEDVCKLRLYWEEHDDRISVTLVPMVFSTIDLRVFLGRHDRLFAELTGIKVSDLDYLKQNLDAWGRLAFYLLSRAIAARVLERFLTVFTAHLGSRGLTLRRLKPETQDFPVSFVFPDAYCRFYAQTSNRLDSPALSPLASPQQALLFRPDLSPTEEHPRVIAAPSGLPRKYSLLTALCRDADAAIFNGREWLQNEDCSPRATFASFLRAVQDPLMVSRGLDNLLDSGLLRAGDANISGADEGLTYSRVFSPGGEFNAVMVSRLALSCKAGNAPEGHCSDERFDSWGEEMNSDRVLLDREERTALFLTLAGIEIKKGIEAGKSVSPRRLYKVLANCVWDWSLLPAVSGRRLDVGDGGDLLWVPHRFGSLGLIRPCIDYTNVRRAFGLFAHLQDLLQVGIYAKYGTNVSLSDDRLALQFPLFLSFEQLSHSRISEIDRYLWPQLAALYAKLDDRSVDTMASCRNVTTTVFSLWTQLVFWRSDVLTACRLLKETPDERRALIEDVQLKSAISRAAATVSHFSRKLRYWEDRDTVIDHVRQLSANTELADFVPVLECSSVFDGGHLQRLTGVRELLTATNGIFQALFVQCGLLNVGMDAEAVEAWLNTVRLMTGVQDLCFRDLANLLFRSEANKVADYVEELLNATVSAMERETGLILDDQYEHYKAFVRSRYALTKTERP